MTMTISYSTYGCYWKNSFIKITNKNWFFYKKILKKLKPRKNGHKRKWQREYKSKTLKKSSGNPTHMLTSLYLIGCKKIPYGQTPNQDKKLCFYAQQKIYQKICSLKKIDFQY